MSKVRQAVRELPNGAAVCGWCDEFEARAEKAEQLVTGAIAQLRMHAMRFLDDRHDRMMHGPTIGHRWKCACESCLNSGCQCQGCAAGRLAARLRRALTEANPPKASFHETGKDES